MVYLKRRENRHNELELYLLALDNLEQGIAICDENFKLLIYNAQMLYLCKKFRRAYSKARMRRKTESYSLRKLQGEL